MSNRIETYSGLLLLLYAAIYLIISAIPIQDYLNAFKGRVQY